MARDHPPPQRAGPSQEWRGTAPKALSQEWRGTTHNHNQRTQPGVAGNHTHYRQPGVARDHPPPPPADPSEEWRGTAPRQAPQPGLARDDNTQPPHPHKAANPSPERRGRQPNTPPKNDTRTRTHTAHATSTTTAATKRSATNTQITHKHEHWPRRKHTQHRKPATHPQRNQQPSARNEEEPTANPNVKSTKERRVTALKTLCQEWQGAAPTPKTTNTAMTGGSNATRQALCQEWQGPTRSTGQGPTTPRPTPRTIDCSTLTISITSATKN